jgi:hypothetical protein
LTELTSVQLSEWEAYDRLDPLGTWREDFRLAYLCSLVTNLVISTHGKTGAKHTLPTDFMLDWDLEKKKGVVKQQTVEQMKEVLFEIAKTHNKKLKVLDNITPPKRFPVGIGKTKGL